MSQVVFDIGGTSMRVAGVEEGNLTEVKKIQTPLNPEEGFSALASLIGDVGGSVSKVVGCIPGVLDTNGTLFRIANIPSWNGCDLQGYLQREVCEDIVLENDAALAALGEAVYGAGKGYAIVAYIGIGTGLGGAKVVDTVLDARAYNFEPGWHYLSGDARFEDLVSGTALKKKSNTSSEHLGHEVFKKLTPTLAKGLYNAMVFWSPEVVVLGGSLVNEENGFHIKEVQEELLALEQIYPTLPDVRASLLSDTAGLHGARAVLCGEGYLQKR